jgi:hypothetical protein
MTDMNARTQKGGQANDPRALYTMPADAPAPPEQSYGRGQHPFAFQVKQAAWLAAHPGDTQGALDYAGGHRAMTEADITKSALTLAHSEANANLTLKFDQKKYQEFVQQRATEIATQLRQVQQAAAAPPAPGPAAPAGAPAPASAAPAAPAGPVANPAAVPGQPPGQGTRQAPFKAANQAHVDWFKKNAKPGQVIDVGGQLFTK